MSGLIEGFLQDAETYEPLAGAEVAIDALGIVTVSDDVGYFELGDLPEGELELRVAVPGRPAGRLRQRSTAGSPA